jgi:hypothetical protein
VKKHRLADLLKLRKKENKKKDGKMFLNIDGNQAWKFIQ